MRKLSSYKIIPSKLSGSIDIPPSKSMAHRAVICAALGSEKSVIENIDFSDDIIATIEAMEAMGARIERKHRLLEIEGIFSKENVREKRESRIIDCNESGSTLRFLIPIACLDNIETNFIGRGNLGKRPLDIYYEIFEKSNIIYSKKDDELDLKVKGKIKPSEFYIRGDVSSQFITGLMFVLPLLDGDSKIIITTDLESKGYLDLTIAAIREFGVEIQTDDYKEFLIKGNQKYKSKNYKVEGDYSQGAFFLCANALKNEVICKDLKEDSLQGDKEIIDILKSMNTEFKITKNMVVCKSDELKGTIIDGKGCPDIIPILSVVASLAEGRTIIKNIERLRIKECDRLEAIKVELNKLGANIREENNELIIDGVSELKGGALVWSHNDHRIAMMLAIAGTRCKEPIVLTDYQCVSKSYPHFFEDFKKLGGEFHEWNMG